MPAFEAAATIGAAISSALSQTYPSLEVVVVDDGSTDETAAIAAAHPGPVRVVHQDHAGVATARNRGIAEAAGHLIAFCDADDILLPLHIEALLSIERPIGGIVTANAYWLLPGGIDPSRTRHKGRFPTPPLQRRRILEQNFVSTMSLFPRSLVDEIGGFETTLHRAEDWDFWLRAILAGHRVAHQPVPHALYRWRTDSLSASAAAMDEAVRAVLRRAAARSDLTDDEREYLTRRLAAEEPRAVQRRAEAALRDGRYRQAAAGLAEVAALVPSETRLVLKARALGVAPTVTGPLVRRRQLAIDRRLGYSPQHER